MSKKSNNNLINAVLYILLGVVMCVFKSGMLNWAMTAVGVIMIVVGVLDILKSQIIEGIVMAAIGVLILVGGWMFVDIILLILGIVLVLKGILDLVKAISRGLLPILAAILTIAVGAMLIVSKWAMLDWLFLILGVVLIIDGVLLALGKKK